MPCTSCDEKEKRNPPQPLSHRMLPKALTLVILGGVAGILIETSMIRVIVLTATTKNLMLSSSSCRNETGYVRYEKIFGHLHIPKTAGTDINGELAARYERICGHKGYSYDAFQFYKRMEKKADSLQASTLSLTDGGPDLISHTYRDYNRGRVHHEVMDEIGFEDCDYISLEAKWNAWINISKVWPLELHVPCRDPLEHLMSQCNHGHQQFDCSAPDLKDQVKKCVVTDRRFNMRLTSLPNVTMKCFNAVPVEPYLEYMDHFLQRRRLETKYIHRSTNKHRDREQECIWKNETAADTVLSILLSNKYFRWCHECIGSKNDLLVHN